MKLSILFATASVAAFTKALPNAILTIAAVPVVFTKIGIRKIKTLL